MGRQILESTFALIISRLMVMIMFIKLTLFLIIRNSIAGICHIVVGINISGKMVFFFHI